jgi:Uma2 family endonuclease
MLQPAQTAPFPRRFTRAEYHRMAEAALFQHERVELLDGVIVTMSPQNSPHAGTVHRLLFVLARMLGAAAHIRVQAPIILNDWSEPEPDIAVCQPDPYDYTREHPQAHQVYLVIEVADASLAYDRTQKARAYAESGIPEYWIVNLPDRKVEVLTRPHPSVGRYDQEQLVSEGERLSLPSGNTVAVADILPPV